MLDQINGYRSAVRHHVQIIMLCWTKLMDVSCQTPHQNNYAMLDQING